MATQPAEEPIMATWKNNGTDTIVVRGPKVQGKAGFVWNKVRPGETVELDLEVGKRKQERHPGLVLVSKDAEVQERVDGSDEEYVQELLAIKGIGKATAAEVLAEYETRDRLIVALEGGEELAFPDKVSEALREHFTPTE